VKGIFSKPTGKDIPEGSEDTPLNDKPSIQEELNVEKFYHFSP
jgi:hypothetical protein